MSKIITYRMTNEQFRKIKEASAATPVMFLSGGQPMFNSPQENANHAWKLLGAEVGFKWETARPCPEGDGQDFCAEPAE